MFKDEKISDCDLFNHIRSLLFRIIAEDYELEKSEFENFGDENSRLIINGLIAIAGRLKNNRRQFQEMQNRINEILDVVVALANLDYSKHAFITGKGDILDALASGINMLGEELQDSTVSKEYMENIFTSMNDMLIVIDDEGIIKSVNNALLMAFQYDPGELVGAPIQVLFKGKFFSKKDVLEIIKNGKSKNVEKIAVTKRGKQLNVICSASVMHTKSNQVEGIVCVMQNVTQQKKAEAKIKQSLQEKEMLLKEIHHRVKNNLQIVSSLISLQARFINDADALEKFRESQDRIKSMALIHEKLYMSGNLARIDFSQYLSSLAKSLFRTYSVDNDRIKLNVDIQIQKKYFNIDTAIPCGLIVNELLSNCIKHAFPENNIGEVTLGLKSDTNKNLVLTVQDNGTGIPENINFRTSDSMGLELVKTLTEQLGGEIQLIRKKKGVAFKLRFKQIN